MFLNRVLPLNILLPSRSIATKTITPTASAIFFKPEVQELLLNLTRIDLSKVFRRQKYGQVFEPPEYKFLTTEEVDKLQKESYERAVKKMQVPPIVPPRDDNKLEKLSYDPEILGHDICKYVFTDITFGISDAKRIIVVREPDGLLREANTFERHKMNSVYFSRSECTLKHPEMFEEENLKSLCNRKEYVFILDRACTQYEPDDVLYHNILNTTFTHIHETNSFELLRSTRYFGSLVFFLCNNNLIDNLLLQNLHCNMIEDAVWLIKVYQFVNPESKCAQVKHKEGQDVAFVQSYIDLDSPDKERVTQALESYTDVASVSSS
uniref:28S ribosomal protein S22, mitochondrial n=1 Tax=Cacopsylla melanoneura TaxID=428564 RepID=A0A8D8W4K9_9HEMI